MGLPRARGLPVAWPNLVASPARSHPRTEAGGRALWAAPCRPRFLPGELGFGFGWSSPSETKPLRDLLRIGKARLPGGHDPGSGSLTAVARALTEGKGAYNEVVRSR